MTNWYKKAQQGLLFYPYGQNPEGSTQQVPPVSVDPETNQNIYKCHNCGKLILEEDTEWYKDTENEGENSQLPQYNNERISQALTEISQYLSPFLQQLFNYIQEKGLESKRNNSYDYGFRSELQRWEVQTPQLRNIANNYPELTDICSFQNNGYGQSNICQLLNAAEIDGVSLLDLEEFIKNPAQEIRSFMNHSGQQFDIKYTVPVCSDCYEGYDSCAFCGKSLTPGVQKYETTYSNTDFVCEECIENGTADTCMQCGKADSSEDIIYMEDNGNICSECYKGESTERISWAKNIISNLDIPIGKNNPISIKSLTNLDEFLRRYIRKYGDQTLDRKEKEKLLYVAKKSGITIGAIEYLESTSSSTLADILNDIDGSLNAQNYMKKQYPDLKNYQDLPFDIDVVPSYGDTKQGFTITISPSESFFDFAEKKYPNIRGIWSFMNDTPHHSGVLAYARCAYEGGNNLVINNLQRDADYDNYANKRGFEKGRSNEAAKWLDSQTKHWDVFLLNLVKAIAMSEDISAYLTTFDQQKQKWGNLPIHKSKQTYQKVPEQMGFSLEDNDAENLIENGGSYRRDNSMYQLAMDFSGNWYKKAQQLNKIAINAVQFVRKLKDFNVIQDNKKLINLNNNMTTTVHNYHRGKDIRTGILERMLKDLGINPRDFYNNNYDIYKQKITKEIESPEEYYENSWQNQPWYIEQQKQLQK